MKNSKNITAAAEVESKTAFDINNSNTLKMKCTQNNNTTNNNNSYSKSSSNYTSCNEKQDYINYSNNSYTTSEFFPKDLPFHSLYLPNPIPTLIYSSNNLQSYPSSKFFSPISSLNITSSIQTKQVSSNLLNKRGDRLSNDLSRILAAENQTHFINNHKFYVDDYGKDNYGDYSNDDEIFVKASKYGWDYSKNNKIHARNQQNKGYFAACSKV